MKKFTNLLAVSVLSLIFITFSQSDSFAVLYSINNVLSGDQQNPPVVGGSGTITGTYNTVNRQIKYTIVFTTVGNTAAGHFHGPAAPGFNAGVQIGFNTIPLGVTSGTFSSSHILTATQETQLLSGLWYANIHTSTFGGGAIRGQIYPVAMRTLDLTYLIQGLYNPGMNQMISDTVNVALRNSVSPFALVESSDAYLNTSGKVTLGFANAVNGTDYYIEMTHRNALRTYSGNFLNFASDSGAYDFSSSASQALGNNLILSGSRYCSYSGDVDDNGIIELQDVLNISNDANVFLSGYVTTDLNGDNIVSLADQLMGYNNAANFVSAIVP